jgi:hypothetical protein
MDHKSNPLLLFTEVLNRSNIFSILRRLENSELHIWLLKNTSRVNRSPLRTQFHVVFKCEPVDPSKLLVLAPPTVAAAVLVPFRPPRMGL